jgi:hypothetical protein
MRLGEMNPCGAGGRELSKDAGGNFILTDPLGMERREIIGKGE